MNFVGPLGPRWRKSSMAAMKYSPADNLIIHIIVSTPVVPPKLQQKVSERFLVNRGVLYDILKVYGDGAMPHRPTHVEPR